MERGLRIRRVGFGKKGQFYLIAAIILATIIIGISVVMNYSKKQDSGNLENLKEELIRERLLEQILTEILLIMMREQVEFKLPLWIKFVKE